MRAPGPNIRPVTSCGTSSGRQAAGVADTTHARLLRRSTRLVAMRLVAMRLAAVLLAVTLLSCSGGRVVSSGSGGAVLVEARGGALVVEREIDPVAGSDAVMLPSGDLVICTSASPREIAIARLGSRLESIWSTPVQLPSGRTVSISDGVTLEMPADAPAHMARAGAAIALLSMRRGGPDSVALVARLVDTATGRILRDTVTMRRAFDASIPEVARVPVIAISPGGTRIAAAIRTKAYGVEMTDLAIQILDPYLNPLETRRIRLPIVEDDGRTDLHVTDDGTILLLSRNRGDSAEILRITPGTSAPARRVAVFTDGGDSLHLRSYLTTLGRDGLLRIAAGAWRGGEMIGIATGVLDFALQDRVTLRLARFGSGALSGRPAYQAIRSLLATSEGSIAVMAPRSDRDERSADGADAVVAALARDGRPLWSRSIDRLGIVTRTGRAMTELDAAIDGSGALRLTYLNDTLLELRRYATRDGAPLISGRDAGPEARALMAIRGTDWTLDVSSIRWADERRLTGLLQRYDELRRLVRLWKLELR